MTCTVFIHPAYTDVAEQCRIYVKPDFIESPRDDYAANPDSWLEIGIMNSRGQIRCMLAPKVIYEDMKGMEPLAAGLTLYYEPSGPVHPDFRRQSP